MTISAVLVTRQWLPDQLHEELTVATLAERAGLSQRTFARSFLAETGSTPALFIETLRG